MDDLLKLIETLRERIGLHEAALRENKALTRSVLIEPLLRALGWDTEDPSQVIPEWSIRSEPKKKVDYALFANSDVPVITIRVKNLDEALSNSGELKRHYPNSGCRYSVETDGRTWIYYRHRRNDVDARNRVGKLGGFNLGGARRSVVCRRALVLWRQRFAEDASSLVEPVSTLDREDGVHLPDDWIPLSKLDPQRYERPTQLHLPTGDVERVRGWVELVPMLTQWLVDRDFLVEANLPIGSSGTRDVVAVQPRHSNGTSFRAPRRAGRFFVETNFGGPNHAENLRTIVERAGLQADSFAVRTRKPNQGGQT